jgi:hypothetical protein
MVTFQVLLDDTKPIATIEAKGFQWLECRHPASNTIAIDGESGKQLIAALKPAAEHCGLCNLIFDVVDPNHRFANCRVREFGPDKCLIEYVYRHDSR